MSKAVGAGIEDYQNRVKENACTHNPALFCSTCRPVDTGFIVGDPRITKPTYSAGGQPLFTAQDLAEAVKKAVNDALKEIDLVIEVWRTSFDVEKDYPSDLHSADVLDKHIFPALASWTETDTRTINALREDIRKQEERLLLAVKSEREACIKALEAMRFYHAKNPSMMGVVIAETLIEQVREECVRTIRARSNTVISDEGEKAEFDPIERLIEKSARTYRRELYELVDAVRMEAELDAEVRKASTDESILDDSNPPPEIRPLSHLREPDLSDSKPLIASTEVVRSVDEPRTPEEQAEMFAQGRRVRVGDTVYGFTYRGAPFRVKDGTDGDVDLEFAAPVINYIERKGWKWEEVKVSYDKDTGTVFYSVERDSQVSTLLFSVEYKTWGEPLVCYQ